MSDPTIKQLIQAWVHVDSDRALSSILEPSEGSSATARGTFLGEDTSDPAAQGIQIYSETKNLPTAIASILNHSQDRANFHPASTPPEQLVAAFQTYVNEIDKNPFLHLLESSTDKQSFYSKDYNLLIDQIVNLYKGISSQDLNELKDAITDMAKSVFGQERSEQWKNIFSQSTIDMSDLENPKFMVYYTSLHMVHNKNGKSDVSEQDYEVHRTSYIVLPDLIQAHADTLAKLDKKSVDDWLDSSTSPERENAKLCFEVKQYSMAS